MEWRSFTFVRLRALTALLLALVVTSSCSGGDGDLTPEHIPGGTDALGDDRGSLSDSWDTDTPADGGTLDQLTETGSDVAGDDVPMTDLPQEDVPLTDAPEADDAAPDLPPPEDADSDSAGGDAAADSEDIDIGPLTALECQAGKLPPSGIPTIDYDQFQPVLGSHCKGTNHQAIEGVQRVVFAGDSITTGTPPTPMGSWYRNVLADELSERFGLEKPGFMWTMANPLEGMTLEKSSGNYWCCSKFGARTDDLTKQPHQQLIECNPPEERDKTTLIVMTVGGNDIFAWAQDLVNGVPIEQLWLDAELAVQDLEDSIHWVVDDPETFPNGVYVVFANTFEFTDEDSASDLATCPGAGIISMDWGLVHPDFLELSTYFTTEYMRIAVETGTDMVFFGEAACGHGYMYDNPEGRCYEGPGADLWLDITCMHPGAAGHAGLADLFLATIDE